MMRCKFDSFKEWLEETSGNRNPLITFQESVYLKVVVENPGLDSISNCAESLDIELLDLYENFESKIRNEFGPNASYWQYYLDMVQTLLDFQ